jgi:hypothetical protein
MEPVAREGRRAGLRESNSVAGDDSKHYMVQAHPKVKDATEKALADHHIIIGNKRRNSAPVSSPDIFCPGTAPGPFFPKDDTTFLKIVGRHFDNHLVAHDRADAKLAHLAGRVSDDPMAVFKRDAETAIGQDFIDLAIERQ